MKKILLVTVGILVATPALAEIPNNGNGVRKNGKCVIEVLSNGNPTFYYQPCSNENVCCDPGWGTACTIDGELEEPHEFLPWEGPKGPSEPPGVKPHEKTER